MQGMMEMKKVVIGCFFCGLFCFGVVKMYGVVDGI